MNKTCNKCKIEKPFDEYYKAKLGKHGIEAICKACKIIQSNSGPEATRRKRKWAEKNKAYIAEKALKHYHATPYNRINSLFGNAIRYMIKRKKGESKYCKAAGWNWPMLKAHLESQFTEGMTWDNYGRSCRDSKRWQIDHIIPRCQFPFKSIEDPLFKECWSLSNLQPLWAIDNSLKGSSTESTNIEEAA